MNVNGRYYCSAAQDLWCYAPSLRCFRSMCKLGVSVKVK